MSYLPATAVFGALPGTGSLVFLAESADRQGTYPNRLQETKMSNRKGFTLIELLIVVVIIGILAAIAIPKFANTKDKAYVAAMKSDLRNMATYEEQYAADNGGAYFGGTATSAAPLQGFSPSQNVTVVIVNVAGPPPSWSGTATHSQSAKVCTMTNGVITCV